jgi:putative SOS response-associated peptidase YedK
VVNRYVGNLQPMPGVFPHYPAPVIRNAGNEREMVLMRWGMPPPPRTGGPPKFSEGAGTHGMPAIALYRWKIWKTADGVYVGSLHSYLIGCDH